MIYMSMNGRAISASGVAGGFEAISAKVYNVDVNDNSLS